MMTKTPSTNWLITWILALAIALVGWGGFEWYWRTQNYRATVMDSKDLWAQHRSRASRSAPPLRVALLGASRIQYGFSPGVFRDEARKLGSDVDPIMLALNGQYPLAALRDLAYDERFKGVAVVGIDAMGVDKITWEMQADTVAYYNKEFSSARELHRRLLTLIQPYVIAARADFAWSAIVRGYIDHGGPPAQEYVTFHKDRSGATDYTKGQAEYLRNKRVEGVKRHYASYVPPKPEIWLANAQEVIGWVKAINRRGGRVVFYREPVSAEIREYDERFMPRASYLDALARVAPALYVNFEDYESLNIDTPDASHIDLKDIPRHTIEFVKILKNNGIL
jgi:hypothetical protein